MSEKEINDRLEMIMTSSEISRIHISKDSQDLHIKADLHGLKCSEAKQFISNLICLVREQFYLEIIHGYNHGTAIKNMLWFDYSNSRVIDKWIDIFNPGLTHMSIA